jgi:glycosyltransferase involved in cell wall biosynthesis
MMDSGETWAPAGHQGTNAEANRPAISVIIPAYNAAATIETAVRSALDQTYPAAEVIVVDDGSTDATAELVSRNHPGVRLLRQENRGCGQARNTGARAATGEWLAFLDADDAWLPQKLERQAAHTAGPGVAVVSARSRKKSGEPMAQEFSFDALWRQNDLIVSSTLVRRSAFEAAGGFWTERYCEDYHLWLRLTAAGWRIVNRAEDLVIYSPTADSLSRQTERFAAAEIACVKDVAERVGMPCARLRDRVVAAYLKHARGAVHRRDLRLARRLVMRSLATQVSAKQLWILAVANTPTSVLDARRKITRHS